MSNIREIHNHNEIKKSIAKCTSLTYVNIDIYFKDIKISYKTFICSAGGGSMCLSFHNLSIQHKHIVQAENLVWYM